MAALAFLGRETIAWLWGALLSTLTGNAGRIDLSAVPWLDIIGWAIALFAFAMLVWPSPRKPSRTERLRALMDAGADIVARVRAQRASDPSTYDDNETVDIVRDGASIFMSLRNEDIPVPKLYPFVAESICVGMEHYFASMRPMVRDGHIAELSEFAQGAAEFSEKQAVSFNANNWLKAY